MALFSCKAGKGFKQIMPEVDSFTRLTNGNGSGTGAAYTVTISAANTDNYCLYVIFQFYISNSNGSGWTGSGSATAAANVDWMVSMAYGQTNSNSLVYRASRVVIVKPLEDATATKVKFSTTTNFGKCIYYVYKTDNWIWHTWSISKKTMLIKNLGVATDRIKELTGSTTLVNAESSTTGAKTLSWTAKKGCLYVAWVIFISNGSGSYTTWTAPTGSTNVKWLKSMATNSSTSDSLVCHAHRITFVRPADDGTCSIYYNNKTSNGRFYYYVRQMSPEVF